MNVKKEKQLQNLSKMKAIRVLSLFSGIGAFEKALKNIDVKYELVNYCDCDKYASKAYSLIHNVDENKNLGDITQLNINNLAEFDLLTHGSPCQDFSVNGKNKGGEVGSGTRSSLMWNTVEIIKYKNPKYVIWENVKNVVSRKHKPIFDKYIKILHELGYNNYYKILNAKNFGIPQNRERIFVISIRKDLDENFFEFPEKINLNIFLEDLLENEVDDKYYLNKDYLSRFIKNLESEELQSKQYKKIFIKEATKKGYKECFVGDSINLDQPNSKTRRGRVGKKVAQTLTTSCNQAVFLENGKIRKLTPLECWRLMGFDDLDFYKVKNSGISKTQLYKMAGNSIVVPVLEKIFEELLK